MQKISISLAVALAIISAVAGIGVGYWYTPQYSLSMYDKKMMDLGQADKWVDLRYLDAMISHHREALRLAEQAGISQKPEIKRLSADILKTEPLAIAELYRWKKEWYSDIKPVQEPESVHLGSYNRTFDLRFLNALVAHHENGIQLTREIRLKSSRNDVLDNAERVEHALHESLRMLREWRKEWYNIPESNLHP
ncbi:MAG: DUF305 domain-containing protein [Chlorobiaceae bacterium]|nr:DUF305 domain-containing protein [Chlorobiaceae bacterium]